MSSGAGNSPYDIPVPVNTSGDPDVLETVIIADQTLAADIGAQDGQLQANVETYNGFIPGPLLRVKKDDTVIVRLINLLDHPTGIHWHGIELHNSADGTEVTQEPALPEFSSPPPAPAPAGGSYLYKFTTPRPGLYWYHPHHHLSTNRVFRGLYGMIVVDDPVEALLAPNVLPDAAHTRQLVISDTTVAKAVNDTATYVDPTTVVPASDAAEWLSGSTFQPAPTPVDLCVATAGAGGATNDDGTDRTPAQGNYPAGDIPSIIRPGGRLNEGQTVLTNGKNVGARAGTPSAPGALAPGAHSFDVESEGGLRLQIVNCCAIRYLRLRLTTAAGALVPLFRIGGEGGLLDSARREGGVIGTYDTKYDLGEILIPPASRADIVAVIPAGLPVGSKLTLWTRDFQRVGLGAGWSEIPTVPVMHLNVTGPAGTPYSITDGTPLRPGDPVETLPAPGVGDALLTPAGGFVAPKLGMISSDIQITTPPGINGVSGTFEGFVPYSTAPHIGSTRYAEQGRLLQLSVTNTSPAHHPFHLHGFSFQPVSLAPRVGAPMGTVGTIGPPWPYREFRDNFDIPGNFTFTFRVRLDDRPLADGATIGGAFGRWLFHCHIFFHHHQGMISELVVGDASGREKLDVDVRGSWAYAPSPGTATRTGSFFSLDSTVSSLTAVDNNGVPIGLFDPAFVPGAASGNWSWKYDSPGAESFVTYVYVTGTDALGKQDQAVFRLKIGAPDDGADNGDPHIHTVDGKYYDFQAVGEFTMLRDNAGLEIQVRQTPVPTATPITDPNSGLKTCVSINTAVAARIGSHHISYQPIALGGRELLFYLDGKPASLTSRGIDLDGGRVTAYPVGNVMALRVDYDNHTVLIATPWFWSSNNVWLLNITVSHTDADMGLMGRIPPGTWLPLLANGASVGPKPAGLMDRYEVLYKRFADSWRVTGATSLFTYAPGTSTETFTDRDWPAPEPPCEKVKPEFEIPGANPPREGIDVDVAERLCKPVTIDDLHKGCVFDVATTGDKSFVELYLLQQKLRLESTAVQIISDKPRTRPGESVTFTAIVSGLTGGKSVPAGTITFLVDDVPVEKPIALDDRGRASWKTGGLSTGVRRIRAEYTASPDREDYRSSSSPALRHRVEQRAAVDRSQAPYRLRGSFYEACDCFTVCPCWMSNNPDGGECTGVFAWEIDSGTIDNVDVSGLRVVSVSHHLGMRDEARQRVVIFVDERASRQQADALVAAFSGRLGGPLQELADLLGELAGVERAPIELRREGRITKLIVDHRIRIEGATSEGPSGRPMTLEDGRLSNVLGTPAEIGESGRFRIGLMTHGMELDLRGRSTMSGKFSYVHNPKAGALVPRDHA